MCCLRFTKLLLVFPVKGFPEFHNYTDTNPLLKVAWYIVTRGDRTLASLFLSQEVLARHLGKKSVSRESVDGEERLNIGPSELDGLDKDELVSMLTNFNQIEQGEVDSELRSSYLIALLCVQEFL